MTLHFTESFFFQVRITEFFNYTEFTYQVLCLAVTCCYYMHWWACWVYAIQRLVKIYDSSLITWNDYAGIDKDSPLSKWGSDITNQKDFKDASFFNPGNTFTALCKQCVCSLGPVLECIQQRRPKCNYLLLLCWFLVASTSLTWWSSSVGFWTWSDLKRRSTTTPSRDWR